MSASEPSLQKWFERECEDYFASHPDATDADFREHITQLALANPQLAELMAKEAFAEMLKEIRPKQ
jgi:hypothetical protein